MSRRYFGTDGVRGRVGQPPMTVDFALRLASAAARVLAPSGGTVLIGKDTRLSGYMFEAALEAGSHGGRRQRAAGRAAADAGRRVSLPRAGR
jgi:phosphomannomutase